MTRKQDDVQKLCKKFTWQWREIYHPTQINGTEETDEGQNIEKNLPGRLMRNNMVTKQKDDKETDSEQKGKNIIHWYIYLNVVKNQLSRFSFEPNLR